MDTKTNAGADPVAGQLIPMDGVEPVQLQLRLRQSILTADTQVEAGTVKSVQEWAELGLVRVLPFRDGKAWLTDLSIFAVVQ